MNQTQLKNFIKECINEVLSDMDVSVEQKLQNYKDELVDCFDKIDNGADDSGECEQRVGEINKEITDMLHDPDTSDDEKIMINTDKDLDSLLGRVDQLAKRDIKETWDEALFSGDLEEDILTEKAPPGMEKWVLSNKERFVKKYGKKKGIGVLYATAWKMFYKNKKRARSSARRSGE